MLPPELIKQIKHIQLKASRLTSGALSGDYLSAFKGTGIEFDKVREYTPGDDVRTLDWNVTARVTEPHVKIFREERDLTLMLLVDVSPSQIFGGSTKLKLELATEIAAVLAFLASKNNDNVGLMIFSDHVEKYIPPAKNRSHNWEIIRTVLTHKNSGQATDIASACSEAIKVLKRRSMCFLISDFYNTGYEQPLALLARRHDVICVRTADVTEVDLPDCGVVEWLDSESLEPVCVDTSAKSVRESLKTAEQQRVAEFSTFLRKSKISAFDITTSQAIGNTLAKFMHERDRRRGR